MEGRWRVSSYSGSLVGEEDDTDLTIVGGQEDTLLAVLLASLLASLCWCSGIGGWRRLGW